MNGERIDESGLDRPIIDSTHITWITLDGEEIDEVIPWQVQAAPQYLSFRAGRTWRVDSVIDTVPSKAMPPKPGAVTVRFIVVRETNRER